MERHNGLLSGHRVVVTGAASGIGEAVADRFAAEGAVVVGLDLRPRREMIVCDVGDEASVEEAFRLAHEGGAITDVVHCAGIADFGAIRDLPLAEWTRILDVNLTGSFLVGRDAARHLGRGGTLTFLASQGGLHGSALWGAYCSSKFGVVGLMEVMARELAPEGIRVNAVCPGGVNTPMSDATIEREAELGGVTFDEMRRQHDREVPLGGQAEATQVADVCLFLASSLASHVAGASLLVNGAQ
jgi:NAD(P)-dependent dehydrogenase (short-subunit alcohol dehydrogenase family)